MKKLLALILLIAGIAVVHYFIKNNSTPSSVTPGDVSDNTFHPDPRSATFKFDDDSVTLSQGKNEFEDPDTGIGDETTLLDENAYGDLNADSKEDTVVLLARSGGGSGVFIYAAAYVSGTVSYKGSNAIFLGDRVSPQSISITNGVATVKYLDRNPDEALASEPTVPASKQFMYKNGEFVEK